MEPLEQLKDMSNRLSHLNNAEEVKSQTLHLQTDCPDCGGSGWIWSRDDNGIPYCEECHCGIRKKMILQNQLQFAEMPDMYKECRFSNMKSRELGCTYIQILKVLERQGLYVAWQMR